MYEYTMNKYYWNILRNYPARKMWVQLVTKYVKQPFKGHMILACKYKFAIYELKP